MKRISVVVAIVLTTSGCVPYPLQETPHVVGRVINASSGSPIAGASLSYKDLAGQSFVTSADGGFDIPAISRWQLVPLAPHDRFYQNTLVVQAGGYNEGSVEVPIYAKEPYKVEIPLQPRQP